MRRCSKEGQSLIELSLFSSLIILAMGVLLNYGLAYNNNQRMQMFAFKRVTQLAQQVRSTYLNASVTLVYDKAIASPANLFGIAERRPVSFSGQAVISGDLYSSMYANNAALPRVVYDINGKVYTLKTAAFRSMRVGRIDFIYPAPGAAPVRRLALEISPRKKEFIDGWNGRGRAWHWIYPNSRDKFDTNTQWDVDADGEEELVLSVNQSSPTPENPAVYATVMDNQFGEIIGVEPADQDPNLRNGLTSDFSTRIVNRSALTNTQSGRRFTTRTRLDTVEILERKIRLNPAAGADFGSLRQQINTNNQNCYGRGSACGTEERDEFRQEADGSRFLIVRSRFPNQRNAYVWTTNQ